MAFPIVMPSFGMYTADGTLVSWLHPSGARVSEGEAVLEIETDKATQEVVAPANGVLHHVAKVGTRLQEQMVIGYVLGEGERPPLAETETTTRRAPAVTFAGAAPDPVDFIKATPIARRLAQERGTPLAQIKPSGPGGRIVEADVLAAANRATDLSRETSPVIPINCRVRQRVPFTGMRKTIAQRLRQSQNSAVALTLTREVPAKQLVDVRARIKETGGAPISVDAFFVKFLALGLRERLELNVVVSGDELVFLDEINIGFAVSISGGLSVPVIREADTFPLAGIEKRLRDLVESARTGRLKSVDIEDGTSTISNLGAFGVDAFTPILNPPQSTILGIGRILPRPVAVEGELRVSPTVWLSLTFDHRVSDGASAAQLLGVIARQMSDERALEALVAQS